VIPFQLPIDAGEAVALADLILEVGGHAGRLKSRLPVLKLQRIVPDPVTLTADATHPETWYIAVQAKEPLILHITASSAPAVVLFPQSMMISRTHNLVISAVSDTPEHRAVLKAAAAAVR
jgi:hypothetical protein